MGQLEPERWATPCDPWLTPAAAAGRTQVEPAELHNGLSSVLAQYGDRFLAAPDAQAFFAEHVQRNVPLVVRGGASHWQAMKWSAAALSPHLDEIVSVAPLRAKAAIRSLFTNRSCIALPHPTLGTTLPPSARAYRAHISTARTTALGRGDVAAAVGEHILARARLVGVCAGVGGTR